MIKYSQDNKRVLVVEADPKDSYLLERALHFEASEGFDFQAVSSLEEALNRLYEETFHVILLDMCLPDSQGVESVEKIRAQVPAVPIILWVDQQNEKAAKEALVKGAEDYLIKGSTNHVFLFRSIRHNLERHYIREKMEVMTQELVDVNSRLEELTLLDPMTLTLNRRGLQSILSRELDFSKRNESSVLGLVVNLDNFKQINEKMGHAAGDVVLKEIASRLKESLRPSDYVAHIGGDEFVILLPQTRLAEGIRVAEKVRLSISQAAVSVNSGKAVHVTASLGLVAASEETPSVDQLLSKSRLLICQSKTNGKNRISYERRANSHRGSSDRVEVQEALRDPTLFLTLRQPIISLNDETKVGYEFLSRSSVAGFEMPDDFFRFSMEANILTLVDHHCFQACIRAGQSLPDDAWRHINLFPATMIATPVDHLIDAIYFTNSSAKHCIEISEQQIIGDPSYLAPAVKALKDKGVTIAIDDVGFGRSCLESLVLLEPDVVKVDKKWVTGVKHDSARRHSLSRLLKVTGALGCRVIAEGIETSDEIEVLRDMGVDYGQGYFFGRPF